MSIQVNGWDELFDEFVCKFPIDPRLATCKSKGRCIVDHLDKKAQTGRMAGDLCWAMQEMRRLKEREDRRRAKRI